MIWRRRTRGPVTLTDDQRHRFEDLALPACRLVHADGDSSRSALGGSPVMGDHVWPMRDGRPLSFLATVDLEELAAHELSIGLPTGGRLLFFVDHDDQPWGFDPSHRSGWEVIHNQEGAGSVTPTPAGATVFNRVSLRAEPKRTFPDVEEPVLAALHEENPDGLYSHTEELVEEGWPHTALHQVGGWPQLVQGPLWEEAQLASNGIDVGTRKGYRSAEAESLRDGSADWRLLLQLDTDERAGWTWGDVGMVYFVIRHQDLAAGRFDRTWMILQCT